VFLGDGKEGAAIEGHDLGYTPGLSSAKPSGPINSHAKIEKRSDGSDTFTFAADSTSNGQSVTVVKDDLFVRYSDRDRLIDKLEGILLDCKHAGTKIKLAKCYDLCGLTYPEVVQSTRTEVSKRDFTPPESPNLERASTKSNKSPTAMEPTTPTSRTKTKTRSGRAKPASDSDYDLSDVPSDLSDGKVKSVSFSVLNMARTLCTNWPVRHLFPKQSARRQPRTLPILHPSASRLLVVWPRESSARVRGRHQRHRRCSTCSWRSRALLKQKVHGEGDLPGRQGPRVVGIDEPKGTVCEAFQSQAFGKIPISGLILASGTQHFFNVSVAICEYSRMIEAAIDCLAYLINI
jgi:hypothetical protein